MAFTLTHTGSCWLSLDSSRWERTHSLLCRHRSQGQACTVLLGKACRRAGFYRRQARRTTLSSPTSLRLCEQRTPCMSPRFWRSGHRVWCFATELFFPPLISRTSDSWGCFSSDRSTPCPINGVRTMPWLRQRDHLYYPSHRQCSFFVFSSANTKPPTLGIWIVGSAATRALVP